MGGSGSGYQPRSEALHGHGHSTLGPRFGMRGSAVEELVSTSSGASHLFSESVERLWSEQAQRHGLQRLTARHGHGQSAGPSFIISTRVVQCSGRLPDLVSASWDACSRLLRDAEKLSASTGKK